MDAWVDEWEIYPGDSLVQKIFEEGLKDAEAVIIVLSEHSVDKPWVREELDASIMKKVEDLITLIPVGIDDCEVPESLRSIVWQKIENLEEYGTEFDRKCVGASGRCRRALSGVQRQLGGASRTGLHQDG